MLQSPSSRSPASTLDLMDIHLLTAQMASKLHGDDTRFLTLAVMRVISAGISPDNPEAFERHVRETLHSFGSGTGSVKTE